jgi:trehalose 6-phosphate synthase/phosphatase
MNSLGTRATSRTAAVTMARQESLSDIGAANPDLSLSGNIISATFSAPHSFTYRSNGNWVSSSVSERISVSLTGDADL